MLKRHHVRETFLVLFFTVLASFTPRAASRPAGDHDTGHQSPTSEHTALAGQGGFFDGVSPAQSEGIPHTPISMSLEHVYVPPHLAPSSHQDSTFAPLVRAHHGPTTDHYTHPGYPPTPSLDFSKMEGGSGEKAAAEAVLAVEAPSTQQNVASVMGPPRYVRSRFSSDPARALPPVRAVRFAPIPSFDPPITEIRPVRLLGNAGGTVASGSDGPIDPWEYAMRKILGSQEIQLRGAGRDKDVYIAEHAENAVDHHATTMPPGFPLSHVSPYTAHHPHFFEELKGLRKAAVDKETLGQYTNRKFIYLNSRSHMQHLNEEYFAEKLLFLPVNPDTLEKSALDHIASSQQATLVLPPTREDGLPVLMVRHNADILKSEKVKSLAGDLASQDHVVSLWSPILQEGKHNTFVLYGLGQLAESDKAEAINQLRHTWNQWKQFRRGPISAIEDLTKYYPH